jgi:hypothetical protein
VLPALVIALAVAWSGFWYFAASQAQTRLAEWRAHEAALGRVYDCARQTVGGFPFRLEVRCAQPSAELRDAHVTIQAKDFLAAVQVYQPDHVIAEMSGRATIGETGRAPAFAADWALAQASVRGLPSALDRLSVVFDRLQVTRVDGPPQSAGSAEHLELHLRQAPRLPQDEPALDVALQLRKGTLAQVAQLAATPVDADISAVLRGVGDLAPKPLVQRLRELQAANGRLEIRQARVEQGGILASGQGTVALTPQGRLDGEIRLTVAGLEQLVAALGLDRAIGRASQSAAERLAPGVNLEKLLGSRGNAALAAAGVAMLGQPAELEGRKAVMLPLRFVDGTVFLGPLMVGQMQPLF